MVKMRIAAKVEVTQAGRRGAPSAGGSRGRTELFSSLSFARILPPPPPRAEPGAGGAGATATASAAHRGCGSRQASRPPPLSAAGLPALGRSGTGGRSLSSHGRRSGWEVSPKCACAAAGHFYSLPRASRPARRRRRRHRCRQVTPSRPRHGTCAAGGSSCRAAAAAQRHSAPRRRPSGAAAPFIHTPSGSIERRPLHSAAEQREGSMGFAGGLRLCGSQSPGLFLPLLVSAGS